MIADVNSWIRRRRGLRKLLQAGGIPESRLCDGAERALALLCLLVYRILHGRLIPVRRHQRVWPPFAGWMSSGPLVSGPIIG